MSTRGLIAERTKYRGFKGRYHHFDSYPEGLGITLITLKDNYFHNDIEAMKKVLLYDHPAGFSTIIDCDFTQPFGFESGEFRTQGPKCYCHGGRSETAHVLTNYSGVGIDFAYVIEKNGYITVYQNTYSKDNIFWKYIGTVNTIEEMIALSKSY